MIAIAKDVVAFARQCVWGLKGVPRRLCQAEVTRERCEGDARRVERIFGWNRNTVAKGLIEQEFGVELVPPPDARGRPRSEDQDEPLGPAIDAQTHRKGSKQKRFPEALIPRAASVGISSL